MAAKQRGGGSKKRLSQRQPSLDIRFHAQPPPSLGGPVNGNALTTSPPQPPSSSAATEVTPPPNNNNDNHNYMQTRREFVFASLVGHRISVTTRDGSVISGVFSLHGNSQLLPGPWRSLPQDPHEATPSPESTFVYTPGSVGGAISSRQGADCASSSGAATAAVAAAAAEDDGWRVVKQKRRSTTRTTGVGASSSTATAVVTKQGGDMLEDTNSSVSSTSEGPPAFELLYAEHRAAKSKQSYLWLRCAYRTATSTSKSSRVMDWLALPWDEVAFVSASDVPDNPDELGSSRPRLAFQTDAEISANMRGLQSERQLQRWSDHDQMNMGNDGSLGGGGDTTWPATIAEGTDEGPGTWDQFSVNEHKFGVKSTYVDGMYSTALNEDVIPQEYIKHADRLAEEMDQQRKNRMRGDPRYQYRSDDSGDDSVDDEEARFSAVAGTGRYANPKLLPRGPGTTTQPSTAGPPHQRGHNQPPSLPDTNQPLYNRRSLGRGGPRATHDQQQSSQPGGHPPPPPSNQRPPQPAVTAVQQRPELLKRQCSSHASNTHHPAAATAHHHHQHQQHQQPPLPPNQHQQQPPKPHQESNPPAPTLHPEHQENAIRNVKDNINALNLEPIKSRKLSQRKEGAWVLPTTASTSQQAADLQEKRAQKKAEFLKSLRVIETNLAKKGWDIAKSSNQQAPSTTAENAASYRTTDTTATPPPTRKQLPNERPSSAAVPEHRTGHPAAPNAGAVAAADHHPMGGGGGQGVQQPWPAAPVQQGSSGTGDGLASEDVSSTAEESLMEKRLFQFNPNATTFTPKGNSSEAERAAPPPPAPAEPVAKPVMPEQPARPPQAGPPAPAVKRSNIAFKPFDPVLADLRRRGKHSCEEATNVDDASEMSMVSHFYDVFVEAAREGVANQPPNQQLPDWDNKMTMSYTDLLQPTSIMTAMPTPPTAATPAFFAPSAPQTPQAIFFPSAAQAAAATLNPAAPPFTQLAHQPHFFNLPTLMRPTMLTQTGLAEPPPGTLQPAAAYHPIIVPQQRWPGMPTQPDGAPWQVLQAAPAAAYAPEMFTTYGLVCQRMPYQIPR